MPEPWSRWVSLGVSSVGGLSNQSWGSVVTQIGQDHDMCLSLPFPFLFLVSSLLQPFRVPG